MKRLLVPVCLALCIAAAIAFTVSVVSSRHELPASLEDMFGDTSGIRGLVMEGQIIERNHQYAYGFMVSPMVTSTNVGVYKSTQDVSRYTWEDIPFFFPSEVAYLPVGEAKREETESERSYRIGSDGQEIPLPEFRIYAELFEVVPLMYVSGIPLALDPDQDKLYIRPEENRYVYIFDYNDEYKNDYELQAYRPGFAVDRSARLNNGLAIGERYLLVPTGRGFYGHTAVYSIDVPGGHVPTVQAEGENQAYIAADELYPIELEYGDEILGFIELEDSVLLAIQRNDGFELTRINPETGASVTVFTEGEAWLDPYYLKNDSLVLISNAWSKDYPDIHVFDLRDGGLERAMSVKSADLWSNRGDNAHYEIKDALWKDGVLYTAASAQSTMGGSGPGEVQITALSATGGLIGRCKLLCGVEEDYHQFWARDRGSIQSDHVRELKSVSLR